LQALAVFNRLWATHGDQIQGLLQQEPESRIDLRKPGQIMKE